MMTPGIEAAASILGAILLDPDCLDRIREEIAPEMFPDPAQRAIYDAACALRDEGRPVDPVTVGTRVREAGGAWSNRYAMELMELTPTSANAAEWCRILRRDAMARALDGHARRASGELQAGQDPFLVAQELLSAVEGVSGTEDASGVVSGTGAMTELAEIVDGAAAGGAFLKTGFRALDRMLGGGLMNGCLYILAARPGQGKTTLGTAVAERAAEQGKTVLFVSLEMTRAQLSARRVAAHLGTVTAAQILTGACSDRQLREVAGAMSLLAGRSLLFSRRSRITVREIQFLARKNRAGLVVIDYLGLLQQGEGKSLYEKVTETSRQLKEMTVALNIPVLCLAQLNREAEGRGSGEPRLSDLRDSGAIEQDADAVLLLHRLQEEPDREAEALTPLDLIVAKNRYGPRGKVALGWSLRNGRIVDG